MNTRATMRRRGFTLVELLVVIAIIGILIALLLPAVQQARESARRSHCLNNIKQIALAALSFENANSRLPAGSAKNDLNLQGPYTSTWTVDLLPYLDDQPTYDLWDPTAPDGFCDVANQRLRETTLSIYLCPSDIEQVGPSAPESGDFSLARGCLWAPGSYRANSGSTLGADGDHYWDNARSALGAHTATMPLWTRGPMHVTLTDRSAASPGIRTRTGMANADRVLTPNKLSTIVDGTSQTFLIGEYHTTTHENRRTFWCYAYTSYNQSSGIPESRTLLPDYDRCLSIPGRGAHSCKRAWGSMHPGVTQFAHCDGSVSAMNTDIDVDVFVATCTIAGEEVETE